MPINSPDPRPPGLTGLFLSLALGVLASGCQQEAIRPPDRVPLRMESLGIAIAGGERSFFLSDRRGGFIVGNAGGGNGVTLTWSIGGVEVARSIRLVVDGAVVDGSGGAVMRVFPDRFTIRGGKGWEVQLSPIEGMPGQGHAIGLSLSGVHGAEVDVRFEESSARGTGMIVGAGAGGRVEGTRVRSAGVDSLVIVAIAGEKTAGSTVARLIANLPASFQERRARMESLLERSYLRVSDSVLGLAIAWLRLSIDALVVDGSAPMLAGSIPWDGSFDARENLRSFPGIFLAGGESMPAGELLDAWGARMDARPSSKTYGRIAGRVRGASAAYGAIDAAGLYARALYDYVIASGDTARSSRLFPILRTGIAGLEKNNLGGDTLIHHLPEETWAPAGRFGGATGLLTAVEIQSLWQMQQTIACIVAQSMHDTSAAKALAQGAVDAGLRFTTVFVDTARQLLFDFVDHQGRPSDAPGSAPILALESLEGDRLLSSLLRRSAALLTPFGPRTGEGGRVETWLTGPFTYALSRSDRQDLAGVITQNLARHALEEGMVGALPAGFNVPAAGGALRADPPFVSLSGMAEFVRLVYQDYLGVRIDAPSLVIRFEPKLPPGLDSVDFTLSVGKIPVRGIYVRGKETSRMTIAVGDFPRAAKWRFLWLFEDGNGWMGAARVSPGGTLTAVFGPEELLLYSGDEEIQPEEKWFIRGLSRRSSFTDLAIPGTTR